MYYIESIISRGRFSIILSTIVSSSTLETSKSIVCLVLFLAVFTNLSLGCRGTFLTNITFSSFLFCSRLFFFLFSGYFSLPFSLGFCIFLSSLLLAVMQHCWWRNFDCQTHFCVAIVPHHSKVINVKVIVIFNSLCVISLFIFGLV